MENNDVNVQLIINQIFDEAFDKDNIAKMIKEKMLDFTNKRAMELLGATLGIDTRWHKIEITDEDQFAQTTLGKYVFSDVQNSIIKHIKKVDPKITAKMIEDEIDNKFKGIIEHYVETTLNNYVNENLQERIDKIVDAKFKKKVSETLDKMVVKGFKKDERNEETEEEKEEPKKTGKKKSVFKRRKR